MMGDWIRRKYVTVMLLLHSQIGLSEVNIEPPELSVYFVHCVFYRPLQIY